ncbi:MAG: NAD(P)H-dependent oxidoreductase subunit E [Terriglobales bacterium]
MRFSDQFEDRFAEWLTHYPVKRSVLVPTLLYVQDELGYLTDAAVSEIASRLQLTELEVRNVISYGAEEVFDAASKKLGIGHKGTTPDGQFSLEEVECIGACSWGPAMQVNYEFHEKLTPEQAAAIIEGFKDRT